MRTIQNPLRLPGDDAQIVEARRQHFLRPLQDPAGGLMLASGFVIVIVASQALLLLPISDSVEDESTLQVSQMWTNHWPLLVPLLILHAFIIYAAVQIQLGRHYPVSILGAILALIPLPPFFILGIPFGIWALVLLRSPDIRQCFATPPENSKAKAEREWK